MATDHRNRPTGDNHRPTPIKGFIAPDPEAMAQYWKRADLNVSLGYHPDYNNEMPRGRFDWETE